jgi:hypothetical protein
LNLVLGIASTTFAALTAGVFAALAQRVGLDVRHAAVPVADSLGFAEVGFAFLGTQIAFMLLAAPFVPRLARMLERAGAAPAQSDADATRQVLTDALGAQRAALAAGRDLLGSGARDAGVLAEHKLADARTAIEALLPATPRVSLDGDKLGRGALSSLQLQRALESLLRAVEELIDSRVGSDEPTRAVSEESALIEQLHDLLDAGLQAVTTALATGAEIDLEAARAREIRMNGIEARARSGRAQPAVLKVVDAYESAGNQAYRLAELIGEVPALDAVDGARA